MIEIKHLKKVFDDDTIPLKDISVTINDGDVASLLTMEMSSLLLDHLEQENQPYLDVLTCSLSRRKEA